MTGKCSVRYKTKSFILISVIKHILYINTFRKYVTSKSMCIVAAHLYETANMYTDYLFLFV